MGAFEKAMTAFDAANAQDPNRVETEDGPMPSELLYAKRMTDMLNEFEPDASEHVKLAVRAQHIQRWKIPRSDYPMDRKGYLKWRSDLGKYHAETAGRLMREAGYEDEDVERVKTILRKEKLYKDPEVQTMEDVACLVFLKHYLDEFIDEHEEQKVLRVLRKTWRKMSEKGHQAAKELNLDPKCEAVVEKALAE